MKSENKIIITLLKTNFKFNNSDNIENMEEQEKLNKLVKIVENHNNKIWQGNNDYYNTYISVNNENKLIRSKVLEDLIEKIELYPNLKHQKKSPIFIELFTQWINEKYEKKEITKRTYTRYQDEYKNFLVELGEKQIMDISEEYLNEYCNNMVINYNLTKKRYNNFKTLINGTFKYAHSHGFSNSAYMYIKIRKDLFR